MKKFLAISLILGFTLIQAEKRPTSDLYDKDKNANFFKNLTEGMKKSNSPEDTKKFNDTLLKNNAQYMQIMEEKNRANRTSKAFENPSLLKAHKILKKLTDLEKEAIEARDFELLLKYNTLQKCLLNTQSDSDIDTCKSMFKDS